jgi:hypothetical protein
MACNHIGKSVGVYGHGSHSGKHRMLCSDDASKAMQIDWMNRDEMAQAIPPSYTKFVGTYLIEHIIKSSTGCRIP